MKALYIVSLGLVSVLVLVRIVFRTILPVWRARRKRADGDVMEMYRDN